MTDTAKRLVGPSLLGTSSATLYTVPASTTTIVRSIHVNNGSSTTIYTFSLGINGTPATLANAYFSLINVPNSGSFDWSGWLVLNAGDTLTGLGSNAANLSVTICGVEVA